MKIALFYCNIRSVPPKKSGGIEKIINYLIDGYIEKGHEVTLFASGDSKARKGLEIVSTINHEIESMDLTDAEKDTLNWQATSKLSEKLIYRQYDFDIIHNHCVDAAIPIFGQLKNTFITTLHEFLSFESIDRIAPFKKLSYISISNSQRKPFPDLNYIGTIYHGIDTAAYPKPRDPEDYMIFAGRISEQKNPHLAILAAKRLQKKLYIVGKYKDKSIEERYFNTVFMPCLKENAKYVEWIGEASEDELKGLFNKALVSLHPVNIRESFGLSAVESMAAGCPAIAFNRGAYVETILDGKTGYIVEDVEEMVNKIKNIDLIDRDICRMHVEKQLDAKIMVQKYLDCYEYLLMYPPFMKASRPFIYKSNGM